MVFLIVLSVLVAAANAAPSGLVYGAPAVAIAPAAIPVKETIITAPVRHQYHAQDELGQYSYGYSNEDGQHKAEARGVDGTVVGNYGYIAPDGQKINVNYLANDDGFQAAGDGIPVAPVAAVAEVKAAAPAVAVAEAPVAIAPEVRVAEVPVAVAPAPVAIAPAPAVAVAPQPPVAEVRLAVAPAPAVAVAPAPVVTEVRAAPVAVAAQTVAVAPQAVAVAPAPVVTEVRAAPAYAFAPAQTIAVAPHPVVTALRAAPVAYAPGPVVTEVRSVPAVANVPAVATTSQVRGEAVASPLGGHVASSVATSAHHYTQAVPVQATEVRTHQLASPIVYSGPLVADTIVHNPGIAYTY